MAVAHRDRPLGIRGRASRPELPCRRHERHVLNSKEPACMAAHWTNSRRARMKAVRLLEYGGQLVFNDVPTPTFARDEILVKIKSTAVNHPDLVEASGVGREIMSIELQGILGHEFC